MVPCRAPVSRVSAAKFTAGRRKKKWQINMKNNQELMAKVNSKDVNEILDQAKKMGFDDLTAEDIMAEFNLSDEALDKVSGGIRP